MPKCHNDPNTRYSGREHSPLGLGWCSHAEHIGKRRRGADGTMYEISKRKTGTRYWQTAVAAKAENLKLKKHVSKIIKSKDKTNKTKRSRWEDSIKVPKIVLKKNKTSNKTVLDECSTTSDKQWRSFSVRLTRLRTLRGDITAKLLAADVHLILVRTPQDQNGNYNTDYPWKVANNVLRRARNHHVIVAPLQVDCTGLKPMSSKLYCQFENIDGKYKQAVISILKEEFGERFQWNGQETSTMIIHLK